MVAGGVLAQALRQSCTFGEAQVVASVAVGGQQMDQVDEVDGGDQQPRAAGRAGPRWAQAQAARWSRWQPTGRPQARQASPGQATSGGRGKGAAGARLVARAASGR